MREWSHKLSSSADINHGGVCWQLVTFQNWFWADVADWVWFDVCLKMSVHLYLHRQHGEKQICDIRRLLYFTAAQSNFPHDNVALIYLIAEYAPQAWTRQIWWVFSAPGPGDNRSTEQSARGADSSAAESHTPEHSPPAEKRRHRNKCLNLENLNLQLLSEPGLMS